MTDFSNEFEDIESGGVEPSSGLSEIKETTSNFTSEFETIEGGPTVAPLANVSVGGQGQGVSQQEDPFDAGLSLPPSSEIGGMVDATVKFGLKQMYRTTAEHLHFGAGAIKFGAGALQFGVDLLASNNFIDEETANAIQKMSAQELEELNNDLIRVFGDGPTFELAEKAGELAPMFAIPQTWGLNKGAGFLHSMLRVISGAGIGAAAGGSTFQALGEDTDELLERQINRDAPVKFGAALGGAAATIPEIFSAIKGMVFKQVSEKIDSPFTQKAMEADRRFREQFGDEVAFSTDQLVDSSFLRSLVSGARSSGTVDDAARGLINRQLDSAYKMFVNYSDELSKTKNFGKKVRDTYENQLNAFRKFRADNASKNFDLFRKIVGDDYYINNKTIPTANVRRVIQDELDDLGRYDFLPDAERKFHDELMRINEAIGPFGAITAKDLKGQLTKWGKAASGQTNPFIGTQKGKEARRVSARMLEGLMLDFDQAIKARVPGASALAFARNSYRADSKVIDSLQNTAVGAFFNSSKLRTAADVERKFSSLAKSDPDALADSMKMLEKADPTLHADLQSFWLESFITKATKFTPANKSPVQLEKLGRVAFGDNRKSLEVIFDTPEKLKNVDDMVDTLRHIAISDEAVSGSINTLIKEGAGVLASQDPTFGARLAANIFTPKALSKYAFSNDAVKALRELTRPYNQNKWAAALMILSKTAGILPMNDEELIKEGYAAESDNASGRNNPDLISPEERNARQSEIQSQIPLGQ